MDYFKYTSFYISILANSSNLKDGYKSSFYDHYLQIIYSILSQDESM